MKTVMKKMFCLMLVAVLLVSAVPFAASAEEMIPLDLEPGDYTVNDNFVKQYYTGSGTPTEYYVHNGALQGETFTAIAELDYFLVIEAFAAESAPSETEHTHTPGAPATCTTAQTCTGCGETLEAVKGHSFANGKCSVCNICEFCGLDENDCTLCDICDKCVMEGSHANCIPAQSQNQVKVYLNLNYGNAYAYGEKMQYILVERDTPLYEVVASVAEPFRSEHLFMHWTTDENGANVIDFMNDARATADGVMIYAQWADIIQDVNSTIDLTVNLGYDGLMGDTITNIAKNTEMGSILQYIENPIRLNYKFVGWYWDSKYKNDVDYDDKITTDCTIYAKWEKRSTNNNILLKIYLNDDTKTLVRTVDMYDYSLDDGYISLNEAKEVAKKYYTSKNSDGMLFEGLFKVDGWSAYTKNHKASEGEPYIKVSKEVNEDTIIYLMVRNAKARTYTSSSSSSSAKADSTNPKTGDAIFAPVMVLGLSASALVVLYYLNKKRAY